MPLSEAGVESRAMTLREYLRRRTNRLALLCVALIGAGWIFAPEGSSWNSVVGATGVAVMVVFAVVVSLTRCPKCKARIGYVEHGGRRRRVKSLIGLDYCRSCGLRLDEEIRDLKRG
jgi:hypothetical protein